MQSHLNALIGVLVVHVVDDVEGFNIGLGQPVHLIVEDFHNLVIVQWLSSNRDAWALW